MNTQAASPPTAPRVLVLACGALARELLAINELNGLDHIDIECLPAKYHMRPAKIVPELRRRLPRAKASYDRVYIGYAECGTQGEIDALLEEDPTLERLPGAHCYEFFAGAEAFFTMHDAEPGTFYLTDYLVRHFDRVVWAGLGLDRHPQLLGDYFGNYERVVYLAQIDDPELVIRAEAAADRLGLRCEVVPTGYGQLESSLLTIKSRVTP